MHCQRYSPRPFSRREMLARCGSGLGSIALAALLADDAAGNPTTAGETTTNTTPTLHFPPQARNIIFLYMDGGPSQVDTFDYKPLLEKYHGQPPENVIGKLAPTQFANVGKVMKSPFQFERHGQSGAWVSELFPYTATHVDDLVFIRSMTSKFSEHTFANYFLHTGSGLQGRPSMGAWINYGLGSLNQNLPGFVVINGGLIPPGGLDNFNSGFLPAEYQGSIFNPSGQPVANIRPSESSPEHQQRKLSLLAELDRQSMQATDGIGQVDALEAAIANYETAFLMQSSIPQLMDLSDESQHTLRAYGIESENKGTQIFGRECLLARRLVERGVRFIELTCPAASADRWDQHQNLVDGHRRNCRNVDQPIAALLSDLKARGLWDSTLVVWTGEFGRTPFAQGTNGRDHNPFGFTSWMAGAGLKRGFIYGETDEWGYRAVQGKVEIHDLHATMLHLLGLDHTRSTFRFSSRDMRLTDVHGQVLHDILA